MFSSCATRLLGLLLNEPRLGDIREDEDDPVRARLASRERAQPDREHAARLGQERLGRDRLARPLEDRPAEIRDPVSAQLLEPRRRGRASERFEASARRGVREQDAELEIGRDDAVRHRIDDRL